jgi:hypothetical protein
VATSFEVTATLSFPSEPPYYETYPDSTFLLRLDDAPDGTVAAIWTNDDGTDEGVFDRGDADLSLREQVQLPVKFGDYDPYGQYPSISFESLQLVLEDRDGDGDADAVSGGGSGVLGYVLGDIAYSGEFTFEIRGDRDATPPQVSVAGNDDALHVLDGLRVVASEPLLPGSTARAWHGDTLIELAPFPADRGYVRSFRSSAVLPFETELRIEIEPVPQDLTGFAVASAPASVRTMPDPGAFAEDGFEADPVARLGGGTVVTGVGTLPAISGARSLLIEPGDELTMRVPLAGGETHLRFRARYLYENSSYWCSTHELRIGAPGAQALRNVSVSPGYEPTEDTGDASWPTAGPLGEVEVALPEGATGHVVFDVYEIPPIAPPCPYAALLIDDLRVE